MFQATLFPELLAQANRLPYDYAGGAGIDYEPYDAFLSSEDTAHWFKAWTGNPAADGSCFRVFGQDGSGGYVALWTVRHEGDLLMQPIVFLGSEGERAVLARHFTDYLWLLAAGLGPCEATSYPEAPRVAQPKLAAFAALYAGSAKTAESVLAYARSEFQDFEQFIESQCR